MAFKTTVDIRKCNGCEECLEVCSAGVLEIRDGKVIAANPDDCIGCESCMDICKEGAIRVEDTRVQLSSTCLDLLKDIL
ncbi:MAG: 4Fe-4S dicluster domain-containing protein [Thermodesulfobacteriota bacterium]